MSVLEPPTFSNAFTVNRIFDARVGTASMMQLRFKILRERRNSNILIWKEKCYR